MSRIKISNFKKGCLRIVILIGALAGCQTDNEILNSSDTQNINGESSSAALVMENSDISAAVFGALTDTQYAGVARMEVDTLKNLSISDNRLTCANITLLRTGTKAAPAGEIIIDYGNGLTLAGTSCTDSKGVQRKGKMVITYVGKRWVPGSYFTIELVDYYRNSVHIEGTELDSVISRINNDTLRSRFKSVLTGGKVTFGDGRTVERNHTFIKTWYRSLDQTDDEWHLIGNASGKNKNGSDYVMEIQDSLIHKRSCWLSKRVLIPVQGVKVITVNNTENYTINFGKGACDNDIIVSFNGKEKTITVTGDGN